MIKSEAYLKGLRISGDGTGGITEMKFDKYSTEMGLPMAFIIFVLTLLFDKKLFYAVTASSIFYAGIHAVYYFKNRLEYSKETLAETSRQNELLTELIRMGRKEQ